MRFLKNEPKMGYYLVADEDKTYFVFDAYDRNEVLHLYEVDEEDIAVIVSHVGDGVSLDRLLISKHPYSKRICKNEFVQNHIIVLK